jgi:transposase-like protein
MLAELRRWRRQADCYGLTLSEFVRSVMNNSKIRVSLVADPQLLLELRRQGNLLNQLLHAAHSGFPVEPKRVETVIDALRALYGREIERG